MTHAVPKHYCHWPLCTKVVHPRYWGCNEHWYKLPRTIRDALLREYADGQEITKKPSRLYVLAARDAQTWIVEHYGKLERRRTKRTHTRPLPFDG